jgi:hypothetical protein
LRRPDRVSISAITVRWKQAGHPRGFSGAPLPSAASIFRMWSTTPLAEMRHCLSERGIRSELLGEHPVPIIRFTGRNETVQWPESSGNVARNFAGKTEFRRETIAGMQRLHFKRP